MLGLVFEANNLADRSLYNHFINTLSYEYSPVDNNQLIAMFGVNFIQIPKIYVKLIPKNNTNYGLKYVLLFNYKTIVFLIDGEKAGEFVHPSDAILNTIRYVNNVKTEMKLENEIVHEYRMIRAEISSHIDEKLQKKEELLTRLDSLFTKLINQTEL